MISDEAEVLKASSSYIGAPLVSPAALTTG
jgi:hypothetical protein